MALAIAVFTFIPPIADLATDTHVFHPGWLPHARVHTVWLLGLTSSIGLLALYLLWFRDEESLFNVNLAGVLATFVYGSFFLSALTARFYGGALSDPQGGIEQSIMGMNLNVFTFGMASIALFAGWVMCKRNQAK